MNLLITVITYNRLKYTQRTLENLFKTVKIPHYIVVVDNNSSDGTQDYLRSLIEDGKINYLILNPENYYPGKATNIGWEEGLKLYPEATHLMRLDNDMHLEDGWDIAVEDYFKAIPLLGQLGIDHEAIEHPQAPLMNITFGDKTLCQWPGSVGGPNIIPRLVWDKGLRYEDMRWNDGRESPIQEDSTFSRDIKREGLLVGHMNEDLARTFANESNWHEFSDYYKSTMADRGYKDNVRKLDNVDR